MLIVVITGHSRDNREPYIRITIDTNQPATFSTADAMFVSRNQTSSEAVSRRPYLRVTQMVTHVGNDGYWGHEERVGGVFEENKC